MAEVLSPHGTPPIHGVEATAAETLGSPLGQKPLAKAKQAFTHAEDVEGALKEAFKRQSPHARVSILTHAQICFPSMHVDMKPKD